jgi:hypothetical protein
VNVDPKDAGEGGSSIEIVDEALESGRRTAGLDLDAAVGQVPDGAGESEVAAPGDDEVAEADPLDASPDDGAEGGLVGGRRGVGRHESGRGAGIGARELGGAERRTHGWRST